ncbi:hypothetical protein SLEP1_g47600 [Rubroshorea leprosula]|uniref:Uncharacterized protein n=1 Tax=Rubroshorea leprosula TaxID=152421 RepID=A0AAV5LRW6_9ROSI|nr:hypothetical protein SLEP1_g47600 [Rubroshorea leprosula]
MISLLFPQCHLWQNGHMRIQYSRRKKANRWVDFAKSSNVIISLIERMELSCTEQNHALQKLIESQVESFKRQKETVRQHMVELRWVFEKGTRAKQETGDESHRTLQAILDQGLNKCVSPDQKYHYQLRMVKPPLKSPSQKWKQVSHPKFPKAQNPRTLRWRLQCKRAEERHRQQMENSGGMVDLAQLLLVRMKSVWVQKDKNMTSSQTSPEDEKHSRSPTSPQVLTMDTSEETSLKATFKVAEAIENSAKQQTIQFGEFSVNLSCLVRTLPLNGGRIEVMKADDKPFVANTNSVEARYYDEEIGTIRFFGIDRKGRSARITANTISELTRRTVNERQQINCQKKKAVEEIKRKLATYLIEKRINVDRSEVVHEGEDENLTDVVTMEELDLVRAKLDDLKVEVQDLLDEVNLDISNSG